MDITNYLYSLRNRGAKLGLERMERLVEALGSPQHHFRSIVVGGTSGKGSTVAMTASILQEAGFRVGMFTSPHLSNLTERIMVDGNEIQEKELERIVTDIRKTIEKMKGEPPTFFETITAAAFLYFKEQKVDFAVLEVGLGGRLDATRVASPVLSIITNISLEHTKILGDTVEKIAMEKAGIIENILITAADDDASAVFEDVCKKKNSKMIRVGEISRKTSAMKGQEFSAIVEGKEYHASIPLLGRHQLENAGCAIAAARALDIPEDAIRKGLGKVSWPGRLEIVQQHPLVVLDCAKDATAMKRLRESLDDFEYEKLVLVLGISSDKDIKSMVNSIVPKADKVVITSHKVMERAADPAAIAKHITKEHIIIKDVKAATKNAISMAGKNDMVLVTGSVFTVADARGIWHEKKGRWGTDLNEIPKQF